MEVFTAGTHGEGLHMRHYSDEKLTPIEVDIAS